MTWIDRLQPAAYTSPSGTRLEFEYEDVSLSFEKKTTVYEFPTADGSFVQDLGRTGRRIPLRVFFSGPDYDLVAKQFSDMLGEAGTGILEHPIYGRFDVVPFGTIARKDNLKSGGNQAVFEITFYETNDLLFPKERRDHGDQVRDALSAAEEADATGFANLTAINDTVEVVSLREQMSVLTSAAVGVLTEIADRSREVQAQFETVAESLFSDLDLLVDVTSAEPGELKTLGRQTNSLMNLPSRADALISDRLVAFGTVLRNSISEIYTPTLNALGPNKFHTANLFASQALSGAISSVLSADFQVREDVLLASETLLGLQTELTDWQDANLSSLGLVDSGVAYQQLHRATVLAAGFLVEISFTLKLERSVVLDRPRSIIDLCAELYGTVDDEDLDFLIESNALAGEAILEIPVGRRIVFYT